MAGVFRRGAPWLVPALAAAPLLAAEAPLDQVSPPPATARPQLVPQSGHALSVQRLVFSPDSKLLASASQEGRVKLWNLETGDLLRTIWAQHDTLPSVAFEPSSDYLRVYLPDGMVLRASTVTGEIEKATSLPIVRDIERLTSVSMDGQLALCLSSDRTRITIRDTSLICQQ